MDLYQRIKIFIIVLLFNSTCFSQSSIYENFLSKQFHNPAFSLPDFRSYLSVSYQKKFTGIKKSPSSIFLSYKKLKQIKKRTNFRFGFGTNIHRFTFGNINEILLGVPFSSHINLYKDEYGYESWFLALGFEPVYSQYIIDEKNLKLNQIGDPALSYNIYNVKKIDLNIGLYLYNEFIENNNIKITGDFGFFAVNILENNPIGNNNYNNINKRLLFTKFKIIFFKEQNIHVFSSSKRIYARQLSISFLAQIMKNIDYLYPHDMIILKIKSYTKRQSRLKKSREFELSFRSNGVIIPAFSIIIKDKFQIGIAYGINTPLSFKNNTMNILKKDNYGSPEIKLLYHF